MKKLLLLLLAMMVIAVSCSKSGKSTLAYANTGTINGQDLGMTICSGGYLITITGVSGPIRFDTLPAGSGIDLATATFPINVKLNWHYASTPDPCGIIVIDAIARVD